MPSMTLAASPRVVQRGASHCDRRRGRPPAHRSRGCARRRPPTARPPGSLESPRAAYRRCCRRSGRRRSAALPMTGRRQPAPRSVTRGGQGQQHPIRHQTGVLQPGQKRACDQIHRGENSARHASALARLAGARSGLFALPRGRRLRRCIRTPTGEALLDNCRRNWRTPAKVCCAHLQGASGPVACIHRASAPCRLVRRRPVAPSRRWPTMPRPPTLCLLLQAVIENAATAVWLLALTSPRGGTSSARPVELPWATFGGPATNTRPPGNCLSVIV